MSNSNLPSIQAIAVGVSQQGAQVSTVRNTFQGIMANLAKRPLKPSSVQQFAGHTTPRSLEQQISSDTAAVA